MDSWGNKNIYQISLRFQSGHLKLTQQNDFKLLHKIDHYVCFTFRRPNFLKKISLRFFFEKPKLPFCCQKQQNSLLNRLGEHTKGTKNLKVCFLRYVLIWFWRNSEDEEYAYQVYLLDDLQFWTWTRKFFRPVFLWVRRKLQFHNQKGY